jgi:hypothetical protein
MLQVETASAPVPKAEQIASFCLHHKIQQETIIKAAWAHLLHVYFDCDSVTFSWLTVEHQGSSSPVAGSEHNLHRSPGVILDSLKTIEQGLGKLSAASSKSCYLQAEGEVDGDLLVSLFCPQAVIPCDHLVRIILTSIFLNCLVFKEVVSDG